MESDDRVLGWKRNRGRSPGVVRLRSRKSVTLPGEGQEGTYTCEVAGRDVISVGLYYRGECGGGGWSLSEAAAAYCV